jgi:hypothetical protein
MSDDVVQEIKKESPVSSETVESEKKETVAEEKPKEEKERQSDSKMHVTDMWGDSRMNPHFLTVAGYFGVTERDYKNAEPKVNEILRWAEDETGSKDIGDIVKKIADTSKALQSPGMGERAYAILYRYIKLSNTKRSVEKEMDAYKKADA